MILMNRKIFKPVSVYGFKLLARIDLKAEHVEPEKKVSRLVAFIKKLVIEKVLARLMDMGEIEVAAKIKFVNDPKS